MFVRTLDGYVRETAIAQAIPTGDGSGWHLFSACGVALGIALVTDFDPRPVNGGSDTGKPDAG